MARSPASDKQVKRPAAGGATRAPARKKAVADAIARGSVRKDTKDAAPLPKPETTPVSAPAPVQTAVPALKGRLFAVTRSRSVSWNPQQPLEQQSGWTDHAQFMNSLEAAGFVVAGGPLEDTPYTFLAVRAENAGEVRSRFAADPWEENRMMETTRIVGWDLKLGAGKL